jgi:hypothetical protein
MFPGKRCDVQIAVNADMGYGAVLASGAEADGALFMGLQLAATWKALFWSAVELQMAFSSYEAPGQGTGILAPVLFIGSRPGFALRLGAEGRHHIVLSTGLGWGEVYHHEVNQEHAADGLLLSPALRYTYAGIFGLEVQAFLPAYPGIVGPYPAAITVNVLGLPLAILVAFAQAMH